MTRKPDPPSLTGEKGNYQLTSLAWNRLRATLDIEQPAPGHHMQIIEDGPDPDNHTLEFVPEPYKRPYSPRISVKLNTLLLSRTYPLGLALTPTHISNYYTSPTNWSYDPTTHIKMHLDPVWDTRKPRTIGINPAVFDVLYALSLHYHLHPTPSRSTSPMSHVGFALEAFALNDLTPPSFIEDSTHPAYHPNIPPPTPIDPNITGDLAHATTLTDIDRALFGKPITLNELTLRRTAFQQKLSHTLKQAKEKGINLDA